MSNKSGKRKFQKVFGPENPEIIGKSTKKLQNQMVEQYIAKMDPETKKLARKQNYVKKHKDNKPLEELIQHEYFGQFYRPDFEKYQRFHERYNKYVVDYNANPNYRLNSKGKRVKIPEKSLRTFIKEHTAKGTSAQRFEAAQALKIHEKRSKDIRLAKYGDELLQHDAMWDME